MDTCTSEHEAMMTVEPEKEHQWLQKLVGEWTFEGEAAMEPGKPPEKFGGTESVRSLGGVWAVAEGRTPTPDGGAMATMMTLGYDPRKKHFVGAFVASMMTHLWVYEGTLDAAERVLTLDTEGPNMAVPGAMAKFRDAIELKSDDHRVLVSHMLGDDGQWHEIMRADYHRR